MTALTNAERSRRHRTRRSAKLARIGELERALKLALPWLCRPLDERDRSASGNAYRAVVAALALTPKENPDE